MRTWEITSNASRPAMVCGFVKGLSDQAAIDLIKAALKTAKKRDISVCSIQVNLDVDTTHVTLSGTYGARYK